MSHCLVWALLALRVRAAHVELTIDVPEDARAAIAAEIPAVDWDWSKNLGQAPRFSLSGPAWVYRVSAGPLSLGKKLRNLAAKVGIANRKGGFVWKVDKIEGTVEDPALTGKQGWSPKAEVRQAKDGWYGRRWVGEEGVWRPWEKKAVRAALAELTIEVPEDARAAIAAEIPAVDWDWSAGLGQAPRFAILPFAEDWVYRVQHGPSDDKTLVKMQTRKLGTLKRVKRSLAGKFGLRKSDAPPLVWKVEKSVGKRDDPSSWSGTWTKKAEIAETEDGWLGRRWDGLLDAWKPWENALKSKMKLIRQG